MSAARRTLALALALDLVVGEPPAQVHPVVWMGRVLDALERRAPNDVRARFWFGLLVGLGVPLVWAAAALAVGRLAPWYVQAALLKPTFAGRALLEASAEVELALRERDGAAARTRLRALVSRPTGDLDEGLACSAAIESLAENFVDSWVAPLALYVVGGLPLAYAYRAANTADAMWGYRSVRYEHLGKGAARLDDALNLAPAWLGALLLVALAASPCRAAQVWRADRGRTTSPNAGQPMAAMAGALDVRLEKSDHYVLHGRGRAPRPGDIQAARGLVRKAMLASALACVALVR
jgi:adenosylcobinamide-phosphate synthase